jgi:adenylate cyclase class 2
VKYEVEQKHPVPGFEAVEARLAAMEATIGPAQEELDLYFAHPVRNFAETDEALRIRRKGSKTLITYKGPKIDETTKTRREIELPLGEQPETPDRWRVLLEVLGFEAVIEVHKIRRTAKVAWHGETVALTLDDVAGVGTFIELEIEAGEEGVERAKSQLAALAEELGLEGSERRSYLELLLAQQ